MSQPATDRFLFLPSLFQAAREKMIFIYQYVIVVPCAIANECSDDFLGKNRAKPAHSG